MVSARDMDAIVSAAFKRVVGRDPLERGPAVKTHRAYHRPVRFDAALIVKMHGEGRPVKDIARKLGCSPTTVRRALYGAPEYETKTAALRKEVEALIVAGLRPMQIVRETGHAYSAVWYHWNRFRASCASEPHAGGLPSVNSPAGAEPAGAFSAGERQ